MCNDFLDSYNQSLQVCKVSITSWTYCIQNTLPKSTKSRFGSLHPLGVNKAQTHINLIGRKGSMCLFLEGAIYMGTRNGSVLVTGTSTFVPCTMLWQFVANLYTNIASLTIINSKNTCQNNLEIVDLNSWIKRTSKIQKPIHWKSGHSNSLIQIQ
jgi:hypothetical protein